MIASDKGNVRSKGEGTHATKNRRPPPYIRTREELAAHWWTDHCAHGYDEDRLSVRELEKDSGGENPRRIVG